MVSMFHCARSTLNSKFSRSRRGREIQFMTGMNGVSEAPSMSPSQQKAKDELMGAIKTKAAPLVELRSPPALGRGYGVTFVLKAAADQLGVPLLGVATALEHHEQTEGQALKALYSAAVASLEKYGVAVIDDLDLACAPRSVRRSRTLIGDIKGSGDLFNWEVAPTPARLLKALSDAAISAGGVIAFSSVEDAHLAFIKAPLTVTLGESNAKDYATVLMAMSAKQVDAEAIYALHSQLSPADLKASVARVLSNSKGEISTEALVASIRDELVSVSAVAPEEVEPVDLADFPGLEGIKEELERNVLFPLENPDQAKKFGLTPKRGVLLHGQPGTGKTTVGRWLANRLKGKFFLVREMMLQADIIKVFAAAQAAAPAVVFIDDADIVIGGWRPMDGHRGSDVFRFLLGRMDGLTSRGKRQRENGDVVVILTGQNVHWMADMLLRSGRIELWLKTKLPEPRQKREILRKYIKEDPGALELLGKDGEVPDVKAAAQTSDSFCCADLRRVVSDAKMLAAWDRSTGKAKVLEGSAYLEKASEGVRRMQDEVHSNARNLYG